MMPILAAAAILLVTVWRLDARAVHALRRALWVGVAIGVAFVARELATDMAVIKAIRAGLGASIPEHLFFYNRGATIMAMCVWPAVAALTATRESALSADPVFRTAAAEDVDEGRCRRRVQPIEGQAPVPCHQDHGLVQSGHGGYHQPVPTAAIEARPAA